MLGKHTEREREHLISHFVVTVLWMIKCNARFIYRDKTNIRLFLLISFKLFTSLSVFETLTYIINSNAETVCVLINYTIILYFSLNNAGAL